MFSKIVVFSGAGISAESGVSTFRDSDGLWENHKIEDVCTYSTWEKNYDLVHKFYDDRREQLKTVFPNIAHSFVSYWQKKYLCLNITTNVDDLFERAGVVDTVHLHGYIPEVYDTKSSKKIHMGYERVYSLDGEMNDIVGNEVDLDNHLIKPNVVFFGEMAPKYGILYEAIKNIDHETIVIVVGASNVVIDFLSLVENTKCKLFLIDPDPKITSGYNLVDKEILKLPATEGMIKVNSFIEKYMYED